jgi:hypothetical protein
MREIANKRKISQNKGNKSIKALLFDYFLFPYFVYLFSVISNLFVVFEALFNKIKLNKRKGA